MEMQQATLPWLTWGVMQLQPQLGEARTAPRRRPVNCGNNVATVNPGTEQETLGACAHHAPRPELASEGSLAVIVVRVALISGGNDRIITNKCSRCTSSLKAELPCAVPYPGIVRRSMHDRSLRLEHWLCSIKN